MYTNFNTFNNNIENIKQFNDNISSLFNTLDDTTSSMDVDININDMNKKMININKFLDENNNIINKSNSQFNDLLKRLNLLKEGFSNNEYIQKKIKNITDSNSVLANDAKLNSNLNDRNILIKTSKELKKLSDQLDKFLEIEKLDYEVTQRELNNYIIVNDDIKNKPSDSNISVMYDKMIDEIINQENENEDNEFNEVMMQENKINNKEYNSLFELIKNEKEKEKEKENKTEKEKEKEKEEELSRLAIKNDLLDKIRKSLPDDVEKLLEDEENEERIRKTNVRGVMNSMDLTTMAFDEYLSGKGEKLTSKLYNVIKPRVQNNNIYKKIKESIKKSAITMNGKLNQLRLPTNNNGNSLIRSLGTGTRRINKTGNTLANSIGDNIDNVAFFSRINKQGTMVSRLVAKHSFKLFKTMGKGVTNPFSMFWGIVDFVDPLGFENMQTNKLYYKTKVDQDNSWYRMLYDNYSEIEKDKLFKDINKDTYIPMVDYLFTGPSLEKHLWDKFYPEGGRINSTDGKEAKEKKNKDKKKYLDNIPDNNFSEETVELFLRVKEYNELIEKNTIKVINRELQHYIESHQYWKNIKKSMDKIKDRVKCVDVGQLRSSIEYEININKVISDLGYSNDNLKKYKDKYGSLIPRYICKVNKPKFTGTASASQFSSDLLESTVLPYEIGFIYTTLLMSFVDKILLPAVYIMSCDEMGGTGWYKNTFSKKDIINLEKGDYINKWAMMDFLEHCSVFLSNLKNPDGSTKHSKDGDEMKSLYKLMAMMAFESNISSDDDCVLDATFDTSFVYNMRDKRNVSILLDEVVHLTETVYNNDKTKTEMLNAANKIGFDFEKFELRNASSLTSIINKIEPHRFNDVFSENHFVSRRVWKDISRGSFGPQIVQDLYDTKKDLFKGQALNEIFKCQPAKYCETRKDKEIDFDDIKVGDVVGTVFDATLSAFPFASTAFKILEGNKGCKLKQPADVLDFHFTPEKLSFKGMCNKKCFTEWTDWRFIVLLKRYKKEVNEFLSKPENTAKARGSIILYTYTIDDYIKIVDDYCYKNKDYREQCDSNLNCDDIDDGTLNDPAVPVVFSDDFILEDTILKKFIKNKYIKKYFNINTLGIYLINLRKKSNSDIDDSPIETDDDTLIFDNYFLKKETDTDRSILVGIINSHLEKPNDYDVSVIDIDGIDERIKIELKSTDTSCERIRQNNNNEICQYLDVDSCFDNEKNDFILSDALKDKLRDLPILQIGIKEFDDEYNLINHKLLNNTYPVGSNEDDRAFGVCPINYCLEYASFSEFKNFLNIVKKSCVYTNKENCKLDWGRTSGNSKLPYYYWDTKTNLCVINDNIKNYKTICDCNKGNEGNGWLSRIIKNEDGDSAKAFHSKVDEGDTFSYLNATFDYLSEEGTPIGSIVTMGKEMDWRCDDVKDPRKCSDLLYGNEFAGTLDPATFKIDKSAGLVIDDVSKKKLIDDINLKLKDEKTPVDTKVTLYKNLAYLEGGDSTDDETGILHSDDYDKWLSCKCNIDINKYTNQDELEVIASLKKESVCSGDYGIDTSKLPEHSTEWWDEFHPILPNTCVSTKKFCKETGGTWFHNDEINGYKGLGDCEVGPVQYFAENIFGTTLTRGAMVGFNELEKSKLFYKPSDTDKLKEKISSAVEFINIEFLNFVDHLSSDKIKKLSSMSNNEIKIAYLDDNFNSIFK